MKRFATPALLYAVLALAGGVFYREFTKFQDFSGQTTLSVLHTHYFLLGMVVFLLLLLLLLLEKSFSFATPKTGRVLVVYHLGLNLTTLMLLVRGIVQVLALPLSAAANGALSGVAGIGHLLLGVSLILLLVQIRAAAQRD